HTYTENPALPGHSPILGWAFDGYPIYGPYGYSNATNTSSAIRRIVSGYVARDGNYGTTTLNVTGRTSYPQWALDIGKPTTSNGPNVSAGFPMGWYVQDFDHLADHGYAPGVTNQPGGVFYDLDRYNGRFCKTPEFPAGTYAYFTTVETNGVPAFPYIIGLQFYGTRTGGDYGAPATVGFTSIETPNYTNYLGGAGAASVIQAPQKIGGTVTLTWSSVEGGHYNVEATTNFTTWTTNAINVRAAGTATATNIAASANQNFFRIARTSLDTYDPVVTP
ncbi:MAG: YHYH protein, partial [Verrucomicrobia bacterium]|nr:YHYH protein [Verrucomicrobiota bacterium]